MQTKIKSKKSRKLALVTGGSGYFGSLLIEKILDRDYAVVNFDLNAPEKTQRRVTFIQGDIRNLPQIKKPAKMLILFFHNVAQVPLAKDKQLFNSVNIDGTEIY